MARPGEITLSHLGMLFLDELAKFSGSTLETLRQPLESGEITISRVRASLSYPCRFTYVAAMNPCPCGYFGTPQCCCRKAEVEKYQKKISGPILDRIDLKVDLERLSIDERFAAAEEDVSPKMRAKVEKARSLQYKRFEGKDIPHNAAIPGGRVMDYCKLSDEAMSRYRSVIENGNLSTRSMDRLAKVTRTIADLETKEQVSPEHVDEAAGFVTGGSLLTRF